jgi:hypothetical protein
MKRSILVFSLALVFGMVANAQTADTRATGDASNQTSATLNQANKSVSLESGTRVSAELQNTIDVRRARVGDQVVLKTTQAIKSQGRTVVGKGAKLLGHITEVSQKSKANGESRIGIIFNRLERGSLELPITATITSITSGNANARAGSDDLFDASAGGSARSASSASSSSAANAGLLGGVVNSTTSTIGTAVGNTTTAAGSTIDSTTNAVGNTAAGVGRSLGRIQISESTTISAGGGSVLSLQGNNLHLEKGTTFNLLVTHSASAGSSNQ